MTNKVLLSLVLLLSITTLYPQPPRTVKARKQPQRAKEIGTIPKPKSHEPFTVTSSACTEIPTRAPLPRSEQQRRGINPEATPFIPIPKPKSETYRVNSSSTPYSSII